jgi:hypothetical protein
VGLGLSLVQAVAKLHGSALELMDQGPGLRVVLTMPSEAAVANRGAEVARDDGAVRAMATDKVASAH